MLICRNHKGSAYSNNYLWWGAIALLGLFTFGCEDNKLAQCEQIFQIARNVNQGNLQASYIDSEAPIEIKSWLQAAGKFDRAADNIAALKITHSQLIGYQNQLATVYRIYSHATYDAVRARENQNLSALKSARDDAIKAGVIQQELIQKINNFCLRAE